MGDIHWCESLYKIFQHKTAAKSKDEKNIVTMGHCNQAVVVRKSTTTDLHDTFKIGPYFS